MESEEIGPISVGYIDADGATSGQIHTDRSRLIQVDPGGSRSIEIEKKNVPQRALRRAAARGALPPGRPGVHRSAAAIGPHRANTEARKGASGTLLLLLYPGCSLYQTDIYTAFLAINLSGMMINDQIYNSPPQTKPQTPKAAAVCFGRWG